MDGAIFFLGFQPLNIELLITRHVGGFLRGRKQERSCPGATTRMNRLGKDPRRRKNRSKTPSEEEIQAIFNLDAPELAFLLVYQFIHLMGFFNICTR